MKQNLVISCPATSRSGYGDHSRDIIRSLIGMKKFNILIKDQVWGDCPQDALTTADQNIHDLIEVGPLQSQPDIWIQISTPSEFNTIGKYNIGITAGIETTLCSLPWTEGMNRMDLVILPSQFSKDVFKHTKFDKLDQNKNKVDELTTTTKMEVLFEGLDLEVYNKTSDIPVTIVKTMKDVKENFCFLVCGHWVHGNYGHDRKDIGSTIKTFIDSFKGKSTQNMPALILKTSSATFSINDREQLLLKIDQIKHAIGGSNQPKVYLLHGDLTDNEMNGLYNHPKIKAMVSFTHGEGFGRPLLEFSITGKPVIVSAWSGHMDFMKEYGILLNGEMKQLDPSSVIKDMLIPESAWFYVDLAQASSTMRDVQKHYKKYLEKTRKQTQYVKENWTLEKMNKDFEKILDDNLPSMDLTLPELPKLSEIQSYE